MVEVAVEGAIYRDALFSSSRVGRVVTGQQVRYVDSIDRRLDPEPPRFDGGHWSRSACQTAPRAVPADPCEVR
jgi:hypothetical protein